jgi:hypothetical protein
LKRLGHTYDASEEELGYLERNKEGDVHDFQRTVLREKNLL